MYTPITKIKTWYLIYQFSSYCHSCKHFLQILISGKLKQKFTYLFYFVSSLTWVTKLVIDTNKSYVLQWGPGILFLAVNKMAKTLLISRSYSLTDESVWLFQCPPWICTEWYPKVPNYFVQFSCCYIMLNNFVDVSAFLFFYIHHTPCKEGRNQNNTVILHVSIEKVNQILSVL